MKNKFRTIKFSELKTGDKFECYGDTFINYNYPKICKCVKIGETEAEEIGGVRFQVNPNDEVIVEDK